MASQASVVELIGAASGPCLMVCEKDLSGIRKKIEAHAWASQGFEALTRQVREWMEKPVAIPERGGQWPHWYACEDCGVRLETVSPTAHRCPSCGRVYSGEPWDSVPLTAVHQGLSQAVLGLGVYYALSRDGDAARRAAEILFGYAERYPLYPVRDHNLKTDTPWATKVSWGTLGESVWLIPMCGGYDLIRDAGVLSPAEHRAIREQLLRPAARLILKHNIGIHNIQCWHNAAIGSAGLMLRDRDLVSFAVEGDVGVCAQLRQGVLADGFWHEGSWGYHFYGMRPLLAWTEALRNCGLDLYDAHYRRMFEAPFKAMLPDGSLPPFHDSGGPHLSETAAQYEIAFARYGEPMFAYPLVRDAREGLNALLYGVESLPESIPEVDHSAHLNRAGFVYLRQDKGEDRCYLALDYGPHGGGHGHPDKLSFVLFGAGQVLAPDPGSVAYGIPIHKKWYKQTVSHNTLVVDGKSQAACTGELEALVNGSDFDLVRVATDEAYEGVHLSRTVLFMHNLVVLIDRMTGDRHHTFDWVYHNRGRLRTDISCARSPQLAGEADGYEVIEDVRMGMPEGSWHATWRTENAGVRLTMLGSRQPTEVMTGQGLDNAGRGLGTPGEAKTPLVIARRRVRRRTTFSAVLRVFGKRPAPDGLEAAVVEPANRGRGVVLKHGEVRMALVATYMPGAVTWEDVTFEGKALFVYARRAPRVVLAEGVRLTWGGRTWTLENPGSIQVERLERGMRVTNVGHGVARIEIEGREVSLNPGRRWVVPEP